MTHPDGETNGSLMIWSLNPFSFDDIKKSFSGPCEFVGVLPWFDPPRHDTVIQYQHKDDYWLISVYLLLFLALILCSIGFVIGDQLAIAK